MGTAALVLFADDVAAGSTWGSRLLGVASSLDVETKAVNELTTLVDETVGTGEISSCGPINMTSVESCVESRRRFLGGDSSARTHNENGLFLSNSKISKITYRRDETHHRNVQGFSANNRARYVCCLPEFQSSGRGGESPANRRSNPRSSPWTASPEKSTPISVRLGCEMSPAIDSG